MSGAFAKVDKRSRKSELNYQAGKAMLEAGRDFYVKLRRFGGTHEEVMSMAEALFDEIPWQVVGPNLAKFRERFEKAEVA